MEKKTELNEKELEGVFGGIANPVAGMSEEEARKIAAALDEGKDMGSWKTMTGAQFMEWWMNSNGKTTGEVTDLSGGAVEPTGSPKNPISDTQWQELKKYSANPE